MKKQTVGAVAAAAALGATTLAWAAPASADLTTRCVGEGGAVTVPGDLVVPRGQSCTLTGTTVTGDVRVAADADLIAEDVTVGGQVVGAENAYVETIGSTVEGRVLLRGAYGSYLDSTEIGGRVTTRPGGDTEVGGFVYTFETGIDGSLVSRSGELFVESSEIGGTVNSRASLYTDVYESFVDGRLLVRSNELGGVVCASAIQGESRFVDNAELVQLGSDGPFADCTGSSYWGSDVTVSGTTGDVYIDNNIVNGDLRLTDNDPVAKVGPNNLVRGEVIGEFESWDGSEPMVMQRRSLDAQPQATPQRRDDILDSKVEQRHATAVKSADRAGTANLGR